MKKNSIRFQVKVYEYAIQGNHLHLLIKVQSRDGIQNFFRTFAGHSAQRILKDFPLSQAAGGAPSMPGEQRVPASVLELSCVFEDGQLGARV